MIFAAGEWLTTVNEIGPRLATGVLERLGDHKVDPLCQ